MEGGGEKERKKERGREEEKRRWGSKPTFPTILRERGKERERVNRGENGERELKMTHGKKREGLKKHR